MNQQHPQSRGTHHTAAVIRIRELTLAKKKNVGYCGSFLNKLPLPKKTDTEKGIRVQGLGVVMGGDSHSLRMIMCALYRPQGPPRATWRQPVLYCKLTCSHSTGADAIATLAAESLSLVR